MTNVELYDELPMLTTKIEARRLQLAGHCLRHPELPASLVITWEPKHGRMNPGCPPKTMVNTLLEDSGVANVDELNTLMREREEWRVRHCA